MSRLGMADPVGLGNTMQRTDLRSSFAGQSWMIVG
jgi:hypothetical protein